MLTLIIPARLASTRLPRKVLLDLGGKPVVQHVWERARQVRQADRVVLLTDSEEYLVWGLPFYNHEDEFAFDSSFDELLIHRSSESKYVK
jgi:CMP-N-acetylneuraminic acid synthetase